MMIEARCNRCGRSTIAPDEMDYPDDMPQPDGRPCGGTFVIPPGPHDFDVYPRNPQKSAVEAPRIPSERRNAPGMGDDSGQIDA